MLVLLFDTIALILLLVIVGLPLAAMAMLLTSLPLPVWALWGLAPLWLSFQVCGMSVIALVLNLLVPRLRPGRYPYPLHPQSVSWLLRFAIQRIFHLPVWSNLIYSFASLRWVVLRSQGARVAWNMQTASTIMVLDPSLITVQRDSMLALGTIVIGHYVENGLLILAPVEIGRGVQLMGEVSLMPGVRIGDGSSVGPGTKLLPDVQVGEDVFVGMGCLIQSGVRIADNVVIGHRVVIEAGVIIEEGAVIRPGAQLPKGTVVTKGTRY
jgi:acetyltransferase-like isoleucine patch superfamily enzyme